MADIKSTAMTVYHLLGPVLGQFIHDTDASSASARKRKPSHMMRKTQPCFFATRKKRKTAERAIDKPSPTETLSMQTMLKNTETDVCGICFSEEDQNSTVSHGLDFMCCM